MPKPKLCGMMQFMICQLFFYKGRLFKARIISKMNLIAAIHKEYNQESSSDYQDNTVSFVLKEIPFKLIADLF